MTNDNSYSLTSPIAAEIGIVEYRSVIRAISETYGYDFSEFALTSMKRRIENFISAFNLRSVEALIDRLKNDKQYFQTFLKSISVESTEMFRDPSFWRTLRDQLLPLILSKVARPRVWFPTCVSGDELYTFCIVLSESNWLDKFEIIATYSNDLSLKQIQSGQFDGHKYDVSSDNYERYQGNGKIRDHFISAEIKFQRNTSLIKNVHFIKQNVNFDNSPTDVKLIIFRNQMLYFTQPLQDKVLTKLYNSLGQGGFIAIGVKEQMGMISSKYFRAINESENIFKKI
ncbi:MAG TPA: CheR family methyltransferase [Bacteroidales bacterium]|nr:CheR family methyltransferase [Bacteroidales bacterium]